MYRLWFGVCTSPHWINVEHVFCFVFSSLIWWFIHLQRNEYAMTLSPNPASHLQLSCQCHSHIKTAFMQQWGLRLHHCVSVGRIQSSHSFFAVCVSLTSLTISPSSPVYYCAARLVLFVVSVRWGIKKESVAVLRVDRCVCEWVIEGKSRAWQHLVESERPSLWD